MSDNVTPPTYTVLCVDDEPNILSSLRRLFRPCGYRVLVAESGAQGLEVLRSEAVDLVISDMRMPHMDGAQFLAAVRADRPDVVRILLTGYADMASTIEAINKAQIYRYINKPWVDEDLLQTVRQGLEARTLQREKERLEALTREQNDALRELNESLEAKVQERTVELQEAHERLKQSLFVAVKIFTSLIEMRHPETAGHSRRVAALSRSIAQRMGVPGADVQNIFLAALLHDIAKIGFSDAMLGRAQRTLSEEERRIYEKHPVDAEMMLMGADELSPVAQLVRHHHECFNGKGFPDGLSGDAIPLGARILLVANDYDGLQIGTISALRFSPEEALQAMEKSRGVRYDPLVLDALRVVVTAPPKPRRVEREVAIAQLRPGMVLSREFVHRDSLPLLTAGQMLTSRLIERMQAYAAAQGGDLTVFVKG